LRCLSKDEGRELLSKVHARICGGHIEAQALAAKVLWQGFYWSTMINNTAKSVDTCEDCQKFSHRSKARAQPSQLITPSWPLQRWGIDIVGKLTPTQGNYTFAIVAVEYFMKWVEVKPVTNITSTTIKKFLAKHYLSLQSPTTDHSWQCQLFW
jgi:hypothetical protein